MIRGWERDNVGIDPTDSFSAAPDSTGRDAALSARSPDRVNSRSDQRVGGQRESTPQPGHRHTSSPICSKDALMSEAKPLDRARIEEAFRIMGQYLLDRKALGEIAIYGGRAILFRFDWRKSSQDVGVFPRRGWTKA
jgi:hypothetical protein